MRRPATRNANLRELDLTENNLSGWSFANQDLRNVRFDQSVMANTDLAGARIEGASFANTTVGGLTEAQIQSTDSYRNKQLRGVSLRNNDLTGWSFAGQDLTDANFEDSVLQDVDLTDAIIVGADFEDTFQAGFTRAQLYSTRSYQTGDLRRINLEDNDLSNWDFSNQNLAGADFEQADLRHADLTNTNLTGANLSRTSLGRSDLRGSVIHGVDLDNTVGRGLLAEQFYSTHSYQHRDLREVSLRGNDLSGWNFAGQDLRDGILTGSHLTDTNFSGADLRGTRFRHYYDGDDEILSDDSDLDLAVTINTVRADGRLVGLNLEGDASRLVIRNHEFGVTVTEGMKMAGTSRLSLELDDRPWTSTIAMAPEVLPDLDGTLHIEFAADTLAGRWEGTTIKAFHWNEALRGEQFQQVTSTANLVLEIDTSQLYTTGELVLTTMTPRQAGDMDLDGRLSVRDIDHLARAAREDVVTSYYDLNGDTRVDDADRATWVRDIRKTWFGDSNLDGVFDTRDLVMVFTAGEYEDDVLLNSTWATGDWNGDGDFTSSDLVRVFAEGGYEAGIRAAVVPEPTTITLLLLAFSLLTRTGRRSRTTSCCPRAEHGCSS